MRRPGPHHKKTDSLEDLRQVQHRSHRSPIFFRCPIFKHLHQDFPDCLPSSSITAISSVPINTVLQQPLRRLRCSQNFLPTYQGWQKRNRPLAPNILRNEEKYRRAGLLRPLSALLHLLQELNHLFSCFFCEIQGNFWVEAIVTYSCFCLLQT